MNTTITPDRLAELAVKALERTAFMMADPAEVSANAVSSANRRATIRYAGPASGLVTIRTNDDFLRSLASNLLGEEPDAIDLSTCGDDAIKELTNILGGSVIHELGGADNTFSLGLPQVVQSTNTPATMDRTCALDCEGHPLFITWDPDAVASKKVA
jgi:CheY-specific phosphatase CheX